MYDTSEPVKVWMGSKPVSCDVCEKPYNGKMIDGATKTGSWACMCAKCYHKMGIGLGSGKGQEYTLTNGQWLKTGG